jgi:hypothetical protein
MSEAFWRGAVNRRAKNLALMKPFFELENNKGYLQFDLKPYDMHLLCSVLMESIIAEMGGLVAGAQYNSVLRELSKVVLKVNPDASASEIDRIASHIIGHLTNERGRGHFEASYQVIRDDGNVESLTHPFRLLEQRLSPEDDLVYIATSEAIHIYLSGLGQDLEAEQAANDTVLDHYLRRGKHREAGEAADMARKRSIELRTRLRGWLIAAERSFDEIQYAQSVLPDLARMLQHVEERGRVEQRQIEEIQARALQLSPGDEGRNTLVGARKAIEESADEHVRLLADLQRCSRTLLDWQSHHRFRRGESPALPDPVTGFLEPVLCLTCREFLVILPTLWPLAMPPGLPVLADLPALMDSLLADTRERVDDSELDPLAESYEDMIAPKRFTPETCHAVGELLAGLGRNFSLSHALRAAEEEFALGSPELAYLSVLVPQWFEHEPGDGKRAHPEGGEFEAAGFFGDDLAVTIESPAI